MRKHPRLISQRPAPCKCQVFGAKHSGLAALQSQAGAFTHANTPATTCLPVSALSLYVCTEGGHKQQKKSQVDSHHAITSHPPYHVTPPVSCHTPRIMTCSSAYPEASKQEGLAEKEVGARRCRS